MGSALDNLNECRRLGKFGGERNVQTRRGSYFPVFEFSVWSLADVQRRNRWVAKEEAPVMRHRGNPLSRDPSSEYDALRLNWSRSSVCRTAAPI